MPESFRLTAREWLIMMVVAVVAVTGIVFLVQDMRSPATNYCIPIDDAVAARIAGPQLGVVKAVAARDPWIGNRHQSVPFANYYVVAMQVTTADGSVSDGLWGVGTDDAAPADGAPLHFGEEGTEITSLDRVAVEHTEWPDTSLPFEEPGTPASRAKECLLG